MHITITGVSKGLGQALTRYYLEAGHTISGLARSEAAISEWQDSTPDGHFFSAVDISKDSEVASFAESVIDKFGPPDLLINNAAIINRNAPLWEISADEIEHILEINLGGVASTIRHFLPAMIARGSGVIVNFSSGWGRSTSPEVAPYCATKWGIEGLSQALAQELPHGLAAVAFNPGVIDTDMLQSTFGSSASGYPGPETWVKRAAPFLERLSASDNGASLTCPDF
ncbi:MAG: SDR family oxidoreductase [Verrucomicrobiota bacterium]